MTAYKAEFKIDFGEVGYWDARRPFRICLDASPLAALIRHAEIAHRVYELLLIERPGDV